MSKVTVNFGNVQGKVKPMHAVNNGPIRRQRINNFEEYKASGIPFARTHDASFYEGYGSEHVVDIQAIFPDFSKNPHNPDSYDFDLTDDYLQDIIDAGAQVFFRFGTKIEHWRKKYGSIVPADFNKWATVCEHIIMHYNEGWANGFHHNIMYWEIWNEPDGKNPDGSQPNWSGTPEEYYELYKVTATRLKKRFPHLKIGGPASAEIAGDWTRAFLKYLTADGNRVPLDFFSWHQYNVFPACVRLHGDQVRKCLNDAGYTETESILDEYNCFEDFEDNYAPSVLNVISMHGAAYTAACMAEGQASDVNMLMYYDTAPCYFNGLFSLYTMKPLKGYYPFVMFSKLYELEGNAECVSDNEHVYAVAATNGEKRCVMITHYRWDKAKNDEAVEVVLNGVSDGEWIAEFLDEERTMEKQTVSAVNGKLTLNMSEDCVVLLTKE